jgi:hypothetical protein
MPLLQYPWLEYDGRKTMRSLADALTKLRELGNLSVGENVEIKTMGIRLPDGRLSGIASVLGPQQHDGTRRVIFMPSSATFSARTTLGERQQYEIQKLNDATSAYADLVFWRVALAAWKQARCIGNRSTKIVRLCTPIVNSDLNGLSNRKPLE